jgi:hypothetical protein
MADLYFKKTKGFYPKEFHIILKFLSTSALRYKIRRSSTASTLHSSNLFRSLWMASFVVVGMFLFMINKVSAQSQSHSAAITNLGYPQNDVNVQPAQDTLPGFKLIKTSNGKVIISWKNNYKVVKQLTIQRSPTGKNPFKSILTLPDPSLPENGFLDVSAPHDSLYYRLYILLDSGQYVFSKVQRPVLDTSTSSSNGEAALSQGILTTQGAAGAPVVQPLTGIKGNQEKTTINYVYVKVRDSLAGMITENVLKKFRDSVLYKTKDTLLFLTKDTILIKPFVPKEVYKPSLFVYTEKGGNVHLSLPNGDRTVYKLRFFELETNDFLFEIDPIPAGLISIDKTNFIRSGWFWFELYEGDKLKERHKLYVPKDF